MTPSSKLDKSQLPEPIYESDPNYIELYWKAWEYAWDHVLEKPDFPQSPYMDEALNPDVIWIWDTCFMVLYCRYAPHYFPGIQSLNNFYLPLHGGVEAPLKIQHVDNPPLFAWVEHEYFKYTGDVNRLKWVLIQNQFLQKHFDFIENMKRFHRYKVGIIPTFARRCKLGYQWFGTPSGMDNTPRGRKRFWKILWIDLLAQQALAAENIMNISEILNQPELVISYRKKYDDLKNILNKYYWNESDGIYYDIKKKTPEEQVKVKTPATYWPMLAGMCNDHQAKRLLEHAIAPEIFGGDIPWPSVSRDDKDYNPEGGYWKGGVWLPLAYMATKALERYGFQEVADSSAEKLLNHMVNTYKNFKPSTIWEVYSPSDSKPATYKFNKEKYRPNFCGWSALGPISMLIENVLGFHEVNALKRTIKWRLYREGRHGIRRFRFGTTLTDIVFEDNQVNVTSNSPYTLLINEQQFKIKEGTSTIEI